MPIRGRGQGAEAGAGGQGLLAPGPWPPALPEAALPGEPQRFDRRAASAGGVAVGHDMNRDVYLLFPLGGHARANLVDEPVLELFLGLQRSSADNQSVGVESVDHLIEKQAERMGLNPEDFPAHRIAILGQTPHELGCLVKVAALAKVVAGIAAQEKWKKRSLDRPERTQRLQVSRTAAVAGRLQSVDSADALVRNE